MSKEKMKKYSSALAAITSSIENLTEAKYKLIDLLVNDLGIPQKNKKEFIQEINKSLNVKEE